MEPKDIPYLFIPSHDLIHFLSLTPVLNKDEIHSESGDALGEKLRSQL
jgi:hypothetical protein